MKKQGKLFINKRDNLFVKFSIVGVCVVVLILLLNVFSSQARNTFYSVSYPLQKNLWAAGVASADFLQSIVSASGLSEKNEDLQSENQKLLLQIAVLKSLQNAGQAQALAQIVAQSNNFELTMAEVIGLDSDDVISISKGSSDGIAMGMPVISKENNLVGKVYRVYKNFSQIMLISNKNSVVNVKVQQLVVGGENEIDGVIKGAGQLSIYLDLIPIDQQIHEGDVLVTSSLDSSFPRDMLVGSISSIVKNDQQPHQSAKVKSFFDISESNVFIITNYKQKN